MKLKSFFTKFTKLFGNSSGFSIAEVMVAAGLLGVVSLGVMEISKVQTKTQKRASADLDMNQIFTDLSLILKDPQNCIASLSDSTDAPNQTATGTAFKTYVASPTGTQNRVTNLWRMRFDSTTNKYVSVGSTPAYIVDYVSGSTTGTYTLGSSRNIRISSLVVKPAGSAWVANTENAADAEVIFGVKSTTGITGKGDVTVGTQKEVVFKRKIKLTVVPDSSGKIYSCMRDELNEATDSCDLFNGTVLPDDDDATKRRCKSITVQAAPSVTTALNLKGGIKVNTTPTNGMGFIEALGTSATVTMGPKIQVLGDTITATGVKTFLIGTTAGTTTTTFGSATGAVVDVNGRLNWGTNSDSGSLSTDANGAIELGPIVGGVARTPYIDFHTNGTTTDYNSRIIANGSNLSMLSPSGQVDATGSSVLLSATTNINVAATSAVNVTGATANITTTGNTTIDAAGTARMEGAMAQLATSGGVVLTLPASGDASLVNAQLVIPTADFVYNSNMGRAVNKDWVYKVLTTTAADSFFDTAAKDAIIDQILNDATGQSNYNILRNNILDYLPTRSQMGISGGLKADLGTNKQYWGTHCPTGYQIRATAYDSTQKWYFVECSPDCLNSGAPCPTVYVSNTLNVTGQICLNGVCKTSWGGVECGIGRFMYGLSAKGYPMCRSIGFEP